MSLGRSTALAFLAVTAGSTAGAWTLASVLGEPALPRVALAACVPAALAFTALPSLRLHPYPTLGPANAITLARALPIAWCAAVLGVADLEPLAWALVFANAFAFGLDWIDGRVARATGWSSPFGARLDMELDAICILVMCALVWDLGRTGPWVFASGALRYLFVAASWVWPWMDRPLFPAPRRAWVCGVQIVCLLGALAPWPVAGLSWAFAAFGLAALVGSFGIDTAWLVTHRHDAVGTAEGTP
ncbi:MAG: CDP-alcohol phosphatidyltransferase family protein [Myxococcota bacterium]